MEANIQNGAATLSGVGAAAPLVFFTEPHEVEHLVVTDLGIQKRMGKPAIIPALPGFKFFFRFDGKWTILTEARSGRMIAHVLGLSRAALQREVAQILAKHGPHGVAHAVKMAAPSMPA